MPEMGRLTLNEGTTAPQAGVLDQAKVTKEVESQFSSLSSPQMQSGPLPHSCCHDGYPLQTVEQNKFSPLLIVLSGVLAQR